MATPTFYTKSEINKLKVDSLKEALNDRGLDTAGSRLELQQRLRHAIHSAIPSQSQNPQNSSQNQTNVQVVVRDSNEVKFQIEGFVKKENMYMLALLLH